MNTSTAEILSPETMPDQARVWIYQSSRSFSERETTEIAEQLRGFITEWAAHGNKLLGTFEIKYNRFIIIYLNENLAAASGCSIDTQVRFIQDLERKFNLNLLDRLQVAYKIGENIESTSMADFEAALKVGRLTQNTIVFNNVVATKGQLKTQWQVPVSESWHARLLS